MRFRVDPKQIQALNDGDEIVVLVRMEPQPNECEIPCGVNEHGQVLVKDPSRAIGRSRIIDGPVAVGDTVEARCNTCGGEGLEPMSDHYVRGPRKPCDCDGVQLRPTVRHIAHREQDDGHHWEVRCGK
jgi:hypothetical protein